MKRIFSRRRSHASPSSHFSGRFQPGFKTPAPSCGDKHTCVPPARLKSTRRFIVSVLHATPSVTTPRFAAKLDVAKAVLEAWPLADELVIEGLPQASGCVLSQSGDGRFMRGIWACTPGMFRWQWTVDETVTVVSGRATVAMGDGRRIELKPGDMAFFEAGQDSVWTIHEPFRKSFHTAAVA
jgi:uncharacterized cupin superfamily protein